jgi:hypothetical protein
LADRCEIYFEDSLISKERILKKYAEFFASALSGGEHAVSIALHTGSVCFNVLAYIVAALGCIRFDGTDPETIVASLNIGDMVLYKNKRYRWLGRENKFNQLFCKLEQDGVGKNGPETLYIPYEKNKHLLKPYRGESNITDGRGIKKTNANRADFISYLFGNDARDIPSITEVSTVVVAERKVFERIVKGVRIIYGNGERKAIPLLDLVTASYYADGGKEYPLGGNAGKNNPVLKVAGKVSTARDLALDKSGSRVIGLMVINPDAIQKGGSELSDLLNRESLKFAHVAGAIDNEGIGNIVAEQSESLVFACTREFLSQNSLPPEENNPLTAELERQINKIVNNKLTVIPVDGGCSWEIYEKVKKALFTLRKSDLRDDLKQHFIRSAYSLLNMFTTAVFPMRMLETAISKGVVCGETIGTRLEELKESAKNAESMGALCADISEALSGMYARIVDDCPKQIALKAQLRDSKARKIAVIVPKPFYIDILKIDSELCGYDADFVTANRFDGTTDYDQIVVAGNFSGKRFDPLKSKAAADIRILLYDCEMHIFKRNERKAGKFERVLNSMLGICKDERDDAMIADDEDSINIFEDESVELERFIEEFDINRYAVKGIYGNTSADVKEVYAVGRFADGERILFSEYYSAVVFDETNRKVAETSVAALAPGDLLVFANRDDYTRNTVDHIYESLQESGKFDAKISAATKKAAHWKETLRGYQNARNLSYGALAEGLHKQGSSLRESAVRQWLAEESHIVGPREAKTLEHIAQLTQDSELLEDAAGCFEACRIVRSRRKKILDLISKAIAEKLSGKMPPKGSELEIVYYNIEKLCTMLRLEFVSVLDEPKRVPINLINKPLSE